MRQINRLNGVSAYPRTKRWASQRAACKRQVWWAVDRALTHLGDAETHAKGREQNNDGIISCQLHIEIPGRRTHAATFLGHHRARAKPGRAAGAEMAYPIAPSGLAVATGGLEGQRGGSRPRRGSSQHDAQGLAQHSGTCPFQRRASASIGNTPTGDTRGRIDASTHSTLWPSCTRRPFIFIVPQAVSQLETKKKALQMPCSEMFIYFLNKSYRFLRDVRIRREAKVGSRLSQSFLVVLHSAALRSTTPRARKAPCRCSACWPHRRHG